MKAKKNLPPDMLDILFEGRNKEYGAYVLRRTYNRRMYNALATTVVICLLLVVINNFANSKKPPASEPWRVRDVTLVNHAEDKKQVEIKPLQPKPKPQVAMAKVTIPKIVPNDQVKPEDIPPANDDLENIKIGSENINGEITDVVEPPVNEGTSKIELKTGEQNYDKEIHIVQIEAQFPGGLNAWSRFLEQNLNAEIPVDNAAPSGRYSVDVSFLVDKEGNISEVQALNNPGFGTAEEAIRVIKKSKQWIPAIQNGRNVIYRQKQSITFEVSEN